MTEEKTILVAIADDHVMMRNAISTVISSFPGFKVIIEADNGKELIERIEKSEVLPTICILDIGMPVMDGYETARLLKSKWKDDIRILALSMYNHEFSVIKMLKNGANGYLLKGADINELKKALLEINTKGYYSSELVASNFFQMIRQVENDDALFKISERELEFLALCCTDMNYKEIARQMSLGTRTIETYRNTLFEKLELNSRIGLVMFAINAGIVPLDNLSQSSPK